MWLALTNGKLRLDENARRALDKELRHAEDVLTGMVFGRLAYLPAHIAWQILFEGAELLRGHQTPRPESFHQELWPTLSAPDAVHQYRVEPDVVWHAPGVVVVVEVKWHAPQTAGQLQNEFHTVHFHNPASPVVVVALGSVPRAVRDHLATACSVPTLLAKSWAELHASVDAASTTPDLAPEHRVLLEDVLGILESRGLRRAQHLTDVDLEVPRPDAERRMANWSVT